MFDELTAIVKGNGMSDITTELTDNSTACLLGRLPGELCERYQPTQPLIDRVDGMFVCEDNTISFPVTPSNPLGYYCWSLVDRYTIRYL